LKLKLDAQTNDIAKSELFKGTLLDTYQNLRAQVQSVGAATFDNVKKANDQFMSAHPDMPLFADIAARLDLVQQSLHKEVSKLEANADTNNLVALDGDYLMAKGGGGMSSYAQRWNLYADAMKVGPKQFTPAPGKLGDVLQDFAKNQVDPVNGEISAYAGPRSNQAVAIGKFFLRTALVKEHGFVLARYLGQERDDLGQALGFPLVIYRPNLRVLTVDEVRKVSKFVESLNGDVPLLLTLTNDLSGESLRLAGMCRDHIAQLKGVKAVADGLFDDTDSPIMCAVSLVTGQETQREQWRGVYRSLWMNSSKKISTFSPNNQVRLDEVSIDQPLNFMMAQEDPKVPILTAPTPAWGALYLWQTTRPAPKLDAAGTLRVELKPPGQDFPVPLSVKISISSRPLPASLDDWPKY